MRPSLLVPSLLVASFVTLAAAAPASARPLRDHAGPYQLEVLVGGAPVRSFDYSGETWLLGQLGNRYTLRITNHTGRRVEAVATVDGRDVMDGKAGDVAKRGYLVPAWGSVEIEGWRLSQAEAAAFRFSSVADSYAGRSGAPREVGVIGVAIFPERFVPPPPRPVYVPSSPPGYNYNGGCSGCGRDRSVDDGTTLMPPGESSPPATPAAAPPADFAPRAKPASPSLGMSSSAGAGRAASAEARVERSRPGLGTEFGEAVHSQVTEVPFERQSATRPSLVLGARYNDREGLLAMGIDVDGNQYASDSTLRTTADPFPVEDRRYAAPPAGWRR